MELAPCFICSETGCQGFIGPYPSAFLDKYYSKELTQRYKLDIESQKLFQLFLNDRL